MVVSVRYVMLEIDPDLPRLLQEEVDDALRSVVTYEDREYDFHHLRQNIQQIYTRERVEEILNELIVQQKATGQLESLFHAGELECAIYSFEKAVMFHFPVSERVGLFISIDRDAELELNSIVSMASAAIYHKSA